MAVAFDNVSATINGISVTTLTTAAFTITGTNLAAMIGWSSSSNGSSGFSGSVGGTTGTLISGTDSGTAQTVRSLMFQVIAPPTGSQTGTMSWTTAVNAVIAVITATGVDQTTPFNNGTFTSSASTASTISLTVTSTSGDLTSTVLTIQDTGGGNPTTNRTKRYGPSLINATSGHAAGDTGPGTGTTTHTWTVQTAKIATLSGANFKQAVAVVTTDLHPCYRVRLRQY